MVQVPDLMNHLSHLLLMTCHSCAMHLENIKEYGRSHDDEGSESSKDEWEPHYMIFNHSLLWFKKKKKIGKSLSFRIFIEVCPFYPSHEPFTSLKSVLFSPFLIFLSSRRLCGWNLRWSVKFCWGFASVVFFCFWMDVLVCECLSLVCWESFDCLYIICIHCSHWNVQPLECLIYNKCQKGETLLFSLNSIHEWLLHLWFGFFMQILS